MLRKTVNFIHNERLNQSIEYMMSMKHRRVQQVGFKTENIINTSELTYLSPQKLVFEKGKCLIYKGKKGFWTTVRRFLPYYLSTSTVASLIYFNPCTHLVLLKVKAVFPAAIPILWVLELILLKMMIKRYQWNQSIVNEIYLLQTGSTSQIFYADRTRRRLFGQPESRTYYNTIFADPIQREKQDVLPNYNPFPQKLQDFQKSSMSWAWCKYYSNGQNYLLIPKDGEIVKKDLLIQLFKGKTIKNSH